MKLKRSLKALSLLLCICALLCGCDSSTPSPISNNTIIKAPDKEPASTEKGSRDNTPEVLVPVADGTEVYSCNVSTIDASHSSEGYIMVEYTGSNEKVKLQITGPDSITYTYNLHGAYEVFPLTAGNGNYNVCVYENIEGTQYSPALTSDITVSLTNEFGPYLYPNQYVDFSSSSTTVDKGSELAYSCNNDIEVVENVYNYIIENFNYDYDKAETVQTGYLPVVDEILNIKTGICFDYASVMATMLRTQRIPTRLEVGYIGEEYHAWISIYLEDIGWINGIIEFDGVDWKLMDPTFASTSGSPKNFTSEDAKYITKYVY